MCLNVWFFFYRLGEFLLKPHVFSAHLSISYLTRSYISLLKYLNISTLWSCFWPFLFLIDILNSVCKLHPSFLILCLLLRIWLSWYWVFDICCFFSPISQVLQYNVVYVSMTSWIQLFVSIFFKVIHPFTFWTTNLTFNLSDFF